MIRTATLDDLDEILKINNSFVPKVSEIDKQWLNKYFDEADLFDVFVEGDKITAFIVGMGPDCDYASENFLWFKTRYDDFLYIDRVVVVAEAQGKGVGRSLYEEVENNFKGHARALACEVNVQPPNPQSYEFHTKLGFAEVGQQDTKGGTIRVAMMMKELNG